MAVKTLRLTKLGRVTSLPIADVHFGQHPSMRTFLSNMIPDIKAPAAIESLRQGVEDLAITASRARKSADPTVPLGMIDKVREFIHFNAPKVNLSAITDILSKVKTPLLATLGIAFVAGISYIAYKVYTNRESIKHAVEQIVKDIKDTAPDLFKVPGWAQSIYDTVSDYVHKYAQEPSKLISKIAEIKDTIMSHQSTINPANMGSGINMIKHMKSRRASGKTQN
jgi:hypothetical protein